MLRNKELKRRMDEVKDKEVEVDEAEDELGDEERARVLAAQLADLDEERCRVVTLGKPRKSLLQGLSGSNLLGRIEQLVSVEMELSGQPLWLFRP